MRPTKIRILGKVFKVSYEGCPEDLVGQCDTDAQLIYVRDGLPLEQEADTLLHEVIHAIDEAMDCNMKETQVKKIATGLLAVMKDNPRLTSYLKKKKPDGNPKG